MTSKIVTPIHLRPNNVRGWSDLYLHGNQKICLCVFEKKAVFSQWLCLNHVDFIVSVFRTPANPAGFDEPHKAHTVLYTNVYKAGRRILQTPRPIWEKPFFGIIDDNLENKRVFLITKLNTPLCLYFLHSGCM